MTGRLQGKRVLVTGGAAGLGAAICRHIANEGAITIVSDVLEREGARLAEEIGGRFMPLDVSKEGEWERLMGDIAKDLGGLDGLVNNAGISASKGGEDIEHIELEDFHHIFAVNVDGTLLGCKHAIPLMSKSGRGSIVNLSSIAALVPTAFIVSYGASKATIAHLTRSIAFHCAQNGYGIRCNSVHPGQIRTAMMNSIIERIGRETEMGTAQAGAFFDSKIPLGCPQEPEDIANGVLFLLSDESRFVTGTQLVIDGGMTLSN